MMVVVAFFAVALALFVQSLRLQQALVREQFLRADAEARLASAMAEAQRAQYVLMMTEARRERAQNPGTPTRARSEQRR
jgi:hypothetical protein